MTRAELETYKMAWAGVKPEHSARQLIAEIERCWALMEAGRGGDPEVLHRAIERLRLK